jgi:nitrite reductase (NADH) small subunit
MTSTIDEAKVAEDAPMEGLPSEGLMEEGAQADGIQEATLGQIWVGVCRYDDLQPECGVTALIGDRQVAIFRVYEGSVYALDNQDPFTGAYVLGRGIVGDRNGVPTVASPLLKQVFDLGTGRCLDDPTVGVAVHPVRVRDGMVELAVT